MKDKVRVFYLRDKYNHPVATVACRFSDDESKVLFSLAVCSPQDTFEKKVGRLKAIGQLGSKTKVHSIPVGPSDTIKRQIIATIPAITVRPQVREAVALWERQHAQ